MSASLSAASTGDDPVLYFTLIDFLVQIIFCAVILFVVFQQGSHAHPAAKTVKEAPPGWVEDPLNLPLMRDMTPFITLKKDAELRELLQRMKDGNALQQFLDLLRHNPDLIQVMTDCQRHPELCRRAGPGTGHGKSGAGRPPCQAGDPLLFSVEAYDDRLVVGTLSGAGTAALQARGLTLAPGQMIPKRNVVSVLSPLQRADCRYSIRYIKRGDSEDMRHLTEQAAHLAIVRAPRGGLP